MLRFHKPKLQAGDDDAGENKWNHKNRKGENNTITINYIGEVTTPNPFQVLSEGEDDTKSSSSAPLGLISPVGMILILPVLGTTQSDIILYGN